MITYALSVLVGILLGAVGMGVHVHSLPPKTVIENNTQIQNVENRNENIQRVEQGQTTIILQTDRTNYRFVDIKADGKTNKTYKFTSVTNKTSKTN